MIDCTCIQANLSAWLNTILSRHRVMEALRAAARRPRSNLGYVSRDIMDGGEHCYMCQTEHFLSCRRVTRWMEVATCGKGQPRALGGLEFRGYLRDNYSLAAVNNADFDQLFREKVLNWSIRPLFASPRLSSYATSMFSAYSDI
jgi:hypothetical protein